MHRVWTPGRDLSRLAAVGLALLTAGLLAGCGGDNGTAADNAPSDQAPRATSAAEPGAGAVADSPADVCADIRAFHSTEQAWRGQLIEAVIALSTAAVPYQSSGELPEAQLAGAEADIRAVVEEIEGYTWPAGSAPAPIQGALGAYTRSAESFSALADRIEAMLSGQLDPDAFYGLDDAGQPQMMFDPPQLPDAYVTAREACGIEAE